MQVPCAMQDCSEAPTIVASSVPVSGEKSKPFYASFHDSSVMPAATLFDSSDTKNPT